MSEPVVHEPPRSLRWQEANFVAEVNSRQMISTKPDPVQELWPWFKSVRLYHEVETEQIARGTPSEQECNREIGCHSGRRGGDTGRTVRQSAGLVWRHERGATRTGSRRGVRCRVRSG